MPSLQTVERFVSLIEAGHGLQAMVESYAEHVQTQENFCPPRTGKAALIRREERAQAAVSGLESTCVRPILISGDAVVIRWIFSFTNALGKPVRLEELAYQLWDSDLLVKEQFFYDPVQLT